MKRSKLIRIAVSILLLAAVAACDGITREGVLTILMTSDASAFAAEESPLAAINGVTVEIVRIEIQDNDGGDFDEIFAGSFVVDLLDISDRNIAVAFNDDVDRDGYNFVRLTLSEEDSFVRDVAGNEFPLELEETSVLVPVKFTIEPEEPPVEILIEVDVSRGLRADFANDEFRLRPIVSQVLVQQSG